MPSRLAFRATLDGDFVAETGGPTTRCGRPGRLLPGDFGQSGLAGALNDVRHRLYPVGFRPSDFASSSSHSRRTSRVVAIPPLLNSAVLRGAFTQSTMVNHRRY